VPRFEVIDHIADVGIVAYGSDLREAFANAAYGMFSLIAELDGVGDAVRREVDVQAPDQEALLVAWLSELIYLFDVEYIVFTRFDITSLTENRLQARVYGEKVDMSRHRLKTAVKGATYHLLKVGREDGYRIQVILDV
jgi:SHS2 domain-containing protein